MRQIILRQQRVLKLFFSIIHLILIRVLNIIFKRFNLVFINTLLRLLGLEFFFNFIEFSNLAHDIISLYRSIVKNWLELSRFLVTHLRCCYSRLYGPGFICEFWLRVRPCLSRFCGAQFIKIVFVWKPFQSCGGLSSFFWIKLFVEPEIFLFFDLKRNLGRSIRNSISLRFMLRFGIHSNSFKIFFRQISFGVKLAEVCRI